ncbi:hypothetical protein CDD81_2976 [Ophiocordyceps australis]|uniref:Uncharacterized protein n=1 Tax=Ophiocordyceps australis TaxID=1399860 RepID=A0A2C5YEQ5_9HYPO|nr:hypothetical protein CDD81_2976 [Ophiocordyceps australis]
MMVLDVHQAVKIGTAADLREMLQRGADVDAIVDGLHVLERLAFAFLFADQDGQIDRIDDWRAMIPIIMQYEPKVQWCTHHHLTRPFSNGYWLAELVHGMLNRHGFGPRMHRNIRNTMSQRLMAAEAQMRRTRHSL